MEPFESVESLEMAVMAQNGNSMRSRTQAYLALSGCILAAAAGQCLVVATVRAAGFDEQAALDGEKIESIGDHPEAAPVRPVAEWDAVISLPQDIPSVEPEPSIAADLPPVDAVTATISDFEGGNQAAGGSPCGLGSACTCGRCASSMGEEAGFIERIHDRQPIVTTRVRAEAILLFRGPPASRPLFVSYDELTTTTGPTVLNANQLASDPLAAPRIAVERGNDCGRSVEAAFLYAGNFYASKDLPFVSNGYAFAPPGIYGNTWGVDNTPLSAAQSTLVANLYSAEANVRSPIGFGATRFLAGFRWLQWGENWKMSDQFSDPADPTVVGVDSYRTNCINNLYGGQIGLDTLLWNRGEGFRVESLVKAGAYYNAAAQSSAYDYATNTGFAFSRQIAVNGAGSCSFVGEVGLTAVMPLWRNVDVRCGYFGLWLEGIAQPLNQLSGQTLTEFDQPAGTLNTKGTAVVQGLSLALEGRW
jgi:hypothetical protein